MLFSEQFRTKWGIDRFCCNLFWVDPFFVISLLDYNFLKEEYVYTFHSLQGRIIRDTFWNSNILSYILDITILQTHTYISQKMLILILNWWLVWQVKNKKIPFWMGGKASKWGANARHAPLVPPLSPYRDNLYASEETLCISTFQTCYIN